MSDYVVRAISANREVRAFAAQTSQLVQEAAKRHQTSPVATTALGRTLTMGAILSATCKQDKEIVTLSIDGNGPLGKITVQSNGLGGVRGKVDNPQIESPLRENGQLDVATAVGAGNLHVARDLGLKTPYHGTSPIISGELAEDFTYYFTASEQTPSSVGLGVLLEEGEVQMAGGYLLQLMPEASEETISHLEQSIAQLPSITQSFAQGMTPEQLLQQLIGDVEFLETKNISFVCTCSQKRVGRVLQTLNKEELHSIIEQQGEAEVVCDFCNQAYHFGKEQLLKILHHTS